MYEKNSTFWWICAFLFIPSFSKLQQNITNNEEVDDALTIRYENSATNYNDDIKMLRYDLYKKGNDLELDEFETYFIKNYENDSHTLVKFHTISTKVNREKNFTSQRVYRDLMRIEGKNDSVSYETFNKTSNEIDNKYNVVPYEMCANITCIPLCCPLGNRLDDEDDKCMPENIKYSFPNIYTNDSLQSEKKVDELFQLTVYDPCQTYHSRFLLPYGNQYDYMIFANGSLYLSYYKRFVKLSSYCLAVIEEDKLEVTICSNSSDEITGDDTKSIESIKIIYVSFHIVSILFLMSIFLIYSILPELRNVHSFILRNYSSALSVAYIFDIVNILITADTVQYSVCLTVAFFNYFCFLTSFLWLTIMSFDVWWTLRGLCSLQKNIKQREKNKLMFYAIYAWGLPFILAVTSIIMDSVSENLPQILRPEFRAGDCWFAHKETYVLYYYGLKSICIINSICLSICTALTIARYEKDTGHHLTDLEGKQYKNNKKWFNVYMKLFILLFIMMGIKWSMMTFSWLFQIKSLYITYIINVVDVMQNLCTLVIFVWKKKIKRLLLKQFSCGLFPEDRSTNTSSLNSSSTTSGEILSMQKKNSCEQKNCHKKDSFNAIEL
ncbi:G-protein coupled receptor Mth2-like [Anoplolepis gracilipes]|uniref:G-protein coupled receptor Mth2-like n=1 Tax=Anoplolepis gracilipes TaxID=354296 RepID=UPI003B9E6E26